MNEADDRLRALFAVDEPAARDPLFSAEVMARMQRRRLQLELTGLIGAAALGGLALWAAWPLLGPAVIELSHDLVPAAAALVIAACAGQLAGRPRPAATEAES